MKRFDLPCYDCRKSFYNKAVVEERDNGDIVLYSYDTVVGAIHKNKFVRIWSGYSVTTLRHVNSFLIHYDIVGGGKSWWDQLDVGTL